MCLGIPGQITAILDPVALLGTVEVAGVKRTVNLACVVDEAHPIESCVGDWVLIHVGFAISRLDEEEAAKTLDLLQEIAEQDELESSRLAMPAPLA